jgi:hypothetical protein
MGETNSYVMTAIEKIIGIVVTIIGGLILYYTATTSALGTFNTIFIFLGVIVVIIGVLLLIVRPQE